MNQRPDDEARDLTEKFIAKYARQAAAPKPAKPAKSRARSS
jgi:hypothetical protein